MPSAVTVYIIHHPDGTETSQLSRNLLCWLRLSDAPGGPTDAGLPVWYRRQVAPTAGPDPGHCFFPEIRFRESRLNVLVLLIDHHFVSSIEWCQAAEWLVGEYRQYQSGMLILPVALHDSFYRITMLYEGHNPIRLLDEPDREKAAITLRRLVSEAITRRLQRKTRISPPKKLDVFLSHAKADGRQTAERIRDSLSRFGQLNAWYDANELTFGDQWKAKILEAARSDTAAMISIVTPTYASRPWCRKEVEAARTPQPVQGSNGRIWKLQPAVAVHVAGESWSRTMQGVAGMPQLDWNPDQPDASVASVVERLMLETMLGHTYRQNARRIANAEARRRKDLAARTLYITWTPCHYTLGVLRDKLNPKELTAISRIVFPGYGLRDAESDELQPILRTFGPDTRLLSFDDALRESDRAEIRKQNLHSDRLIKPRRIAVSGIGTDTELRPHGLGSDHLDELHIRLAIALLRENAQLFLGGILEKVNGTSTMSLVDLAQTWLPAARVKKIRPGKPTTWPIQNYLQWPDCDGLTLEQQAALTGICRMHVVYPAGLPPLSVTQHMDLGTQRRYAADSIRAARQTITQTTDMRVIFGGLLGSTGGWMPVALEEAGLSIRSRKPLIILGGFGGASAEIAAFLKTPSAPLSEVLQYSQDRILRRCSDLSESTLKSLADFHHGILQALHQFRTQLHARSAKRQFINKIPRDLLHAALEEDNIRRAIGLVIEALRHIS